MEKPNNIVFFSPSHYIQCIGWNCLKNIEFLQKILLDLRIPMAELEAVVYEGFQDWFKSLQKLLVKFHAVTNCSLIEKILNYKIINLRLKAPLIPLKVTSVFLAWSSDLFLLFFENLLVHWLYTFFLATRLITLLVNLCSLLPNRLVIYD